jgi:hypothetical protein
MCPPPPDDDNYTQDLLERRRGTTDRLGITDAGFTVFFGINRGQARDGAGPLAEIQLSGDGKEPNPKDNVQGAVLKELEDICGRYGLPLGRAKRAARQLLQKDYVPSVPAPKIAPAQWSELKEEDKALSPVEFLNKHWGKFIEDDVINQCEFRKFDESLFQAVRYYCNTQTPPLDPYDFLPSPTTGKGSRPQRKPKTRRSSATLASGKSRRGNLTPVVSPISHRPRRHGAGKAVTPTPN